jgi:hypothetical protein
MLIAIDETLHVETIMKIIVVNQVLGLQVIIKLS